MLSKQCLYDCAIDL
jgi:hypothetical protein